MVSMIEFAASAARTITGTGAAMDLMDSKELSVMLDVTAASGTTPTLDVQAEHAPDGVCWTNLGTAFTQATGVTRATKVYTQFYRFARLKWTVAGTTPSFTFALLGNAKP
jgi:hypothetical protein